MTSLKFGIIFVVKLLEFEMSVKPEEKPLGKESKECSPGLGLSCLSAFLPLLGVFRSDPAQATALAS